MKKFVLLLTLFASILLRKGCDKACVACIDTCTNGYTATTEDYNNCITICSTPDRKFKNKFSSSRLQKKKY